MNDAPTFDPCVRYLAADPHRWHSFLAGMWFGAGLLLLVVFAVWLWVDIRRTNAELKEVLEKDLS